MCYNIQSFTNCNITHGIQSAWSELFDEEIQPTENPRSTPKSKPFEDLLRDSHLRRRSPCGFCAGPALPGDVKTWLE